VEVTAADIRGSISIAVADNGPGIAESIQERLFHPFVSYGKENGTGLGLAVVQKIVQDHSGEIVVERTAQGRTIFRITLPCRQDAAPSESASAFSNVRSLVSAERDAAIQNSISHPGP
jgi:nitrogen-specific signal transduction histidine kinase